MKFTAQWGSHPTNSRDKALELVEEGIVSAEDMLNMALKYMSEAEVADMLEHNELEWTV